MPRGSLKEPLLLNIERIREDLDAISPHHIRLHYRDAPTFYRQQHPYHGRLSDTYDEEKNSRRINRQFGELNQQFRRYDPTAKVRISDPSLSKAHSVGSQSRGLIVQPRRGMPPTNRLFPPGESNPLAKKDAWWDARGLVRKPRATRKRRRTRRRRKTRGRHMRRKPKK